MNDEIRKYVFDHLLKIMRECGGPFVVLDRSGKTGIEAISWPLVPDDVAKEAISWAVRNIDLAAADGPQLTEQHGWRFVAIASLGGKACFLSGRSDDERLEREMVSLEVRDIMNDVGMPKVRWTDAALACWTFETDDFAEQQRVFDRWCRWFGFRETDRRERVEGDVWWVRKVRP